MGRRGQVLDDAQLDAIINSFQGRQIIDMMRYTARGTADEVADYLTWFTEHAKADELMISLQNASHGEVLAGMEILAKRWIG